MALRRTRQAAVDGSPVQFCGEFNIELVVLFGSAVHSDAWGISPSPLRRASRVTSWWLSTPFERTFPRDQLNSMDLDRAEPDARHGAPSRGEILYRTSPEVSTL